MKLAYVFPGQGSQSTAMLQQLATVYPIVEQTFAIASDTLGYDLWQIVQDGSKLNQTAITQPAMLAAGISVYKICQDKISTQASVMAGHSLGEYSALVAAQALDFREAIKLVKIRGELMQDAVPAGEGAMAAILGLDDATVKSVCSEINGIVQAVNFNSPGQVVIAGKKSSVESACELAKLNGARRALILPVSVPSHSSLMKPAALKFAEVLDEITINAPQIPVINNVDAKAEIEPDIIRGALVRQLYNPVRWVDIINNMSQQNISHIIESGPGKVLLGLNKRIVKTVANYSVQDLSSLEILETAFK